MAFESLETRRLLAAVSWDGGGESNDWHDPLNWSNDMLPGASDDVTIVTTGGVRLNGVGAVRTINSNASLTIRGELRIGQSSRLDGKITLENGTIHLESGVLPLTGVAELTNATFAGAGTVQFVAMHGDAPGPWSDPLILDSQTLSIENTLWVGFPVRFRDTTVTGPGTLRITQDIYEASGFIDSRVEVAKVVFDRGNMHFDGGVLAGVFENHGELEFSGDFDTGPFAVGVIDNANELHLTPGISVTSPEQHIATRPNKSVSITLDEADVDLGVRLTGAGRYYVGALGGRGYGEGATLRLTDHALPNGVLTDEAWYISSGATLDFGTPLRVVEGTLDLVGYNNANGQRAGGRVVGLSELQRNGGVLNLSHNAPAEDQPRNLLNEGYMTLPVGGVTLMGDLTQTTGATLRINTADAEAGALPLQVLGTATIAGHLSGTLVIGGLVLPVDSALPVVKAAKGIVGDFETVNVTSGTSGRLINSRNFGDTIGLVVGPVASSAARIVAEDDSGWFDNDNVTTVRNPRLTGTLSEGVGVLIYLAYPGVGILGDPIYVAAENGVWISPPIDFPTNAFAVSVMTIDEFGNVSPRVDSLINVDTEVEYFFSRYDFERTGQFQINFRDHISPTAITELRADQFRITNLTTGQPVTNVVTSVRTTPLSFRNPETLVTFTHASGLFPDGDYRLSFAEGMTDAAGNPIDDVFDFFVLTGDLDRDRDVDLFDAARLERNFGRIDNPLFSEGDIDYDGDVDLFDAALLERRFGTYLAPPNTNFGHLSGRPGKAGGSSLFSDGPINARIGLLRELTT